MTAEISLIHQVEASLIKHLKIQMITPNHTYQLPYNALRHISEKITFNPHNEFISYDGKVIGMLRFRKKQDFEYDIHNRCYNLNKEIVTECALIELEDYEGPELFHEQMEAYLDLSPFIGKVLELENVSIEDAVLRLKKTLEELT